MLRKHWTEEKIIVALQSLRDKLGRVPKSQETFFTGTAIKIFGSWNKALEAAHLEPNVHHYTPRGIIQLIRAEARKRGSPPRSTDVPWQDAAARLFGSWGKAVRAAGFRNYSTRPYKKKYTKEKIIRLIRDDYKKTGKVPVAEKTKYYRSAFRLFGSWNGVLRASGLPLNRPTSAGRTGCSSIQKQSKIREGAKCSEN